MMPVVMIVFWRGMPWRLRERAFESWMLERGEGRKLLRPGLG